MMRWVRNLFRSPEHGPATPAAGATRTGQQLPGFPDFLPAAPAAPDWTVDHQVVLNRFMESEAGKAFWQRMLAVEVDLSRRMVQDCMHTAHSAGIAAGFGQACRWISSLRYAQTEEEFSGQSSPEHDDNAVAGEKAKTDERDPKGEDRLLERYSP